MTACDAIGLDEGVLMDSLLGQYGETCGGRADLRQMRRESLDLYDGLPGSRIANASAARVVVPARLLRS